MPNASYCAWIVDPAHWGGGIELAILASHYRSEGVGVAEASQGQAGSTNLSKCACSRHSANRHTCNRHTCNRHTFCASGCNDYKRSRVLGHLAELFLVIGEMSSAASLEIHCRQLLVKGASAAFQAPQMIHGEL
jgi:hypothetical protein